MKKIEVLVGDVEVDLASVVVISTFQRGIFRTRSFIEKPILLDLDAVKIRSEDLSWVISNSLREVKIRVSSDEKWGVLFRGDPEILHGVHWRLGFSLFDCLGKIASEGDRMEVYKYLQRVKPPIHLIHKWLVSSALLFPENLELLMKVDELLFKVSAQRIHSLLAFAWIPVRSGLRFKYSFKKKGG